MWTCAHPPSRPLSLARPPPPPPSQICRGFEVNLAQSRENDFAFPMLSLLVFGAATVPTASSRPLTVAPIGRHCTTAQCGFARRTIVGRAALAGTVSLLPLRAIAEFGEGAKQAPPALIPSPFRPADGRDRRAPARWWRSADREDVCLARAEETDCSPPTTICSWRRRATRRTSSRQR